VEFGLLPFGADSLTHFLYLERPEGMERVDASEFVPAAPPVLAGMLRQHLHAFGIAPDGRLFRGTRGRMLSESV
jgi:hypothetical protein